MDSFNLVLLGPPGCGKGTVSKHIIKNYNFKHISTGDILREEAKRNNSIRQIINKGEFVDDSFILSLLTRNLESGSNYILDGYPRNLEQGKKCDFVNLVIYIDLDDETCINRILNRNEGRIDDNRETVRHRLTLYNQSTKPLVDYFKKKGILQEVDGVGKIDEINERVDMILKKIKTIN